MNDDERTIRAAWARLGAPTTASQLEHLLRRYREPHRRYHTTRHLAAVLAAITELEAHLGAGEQCDIHAVLLAALFHDVVYQPLATDNEAVSAELGAQCALDLGWAPSRAETVRRLVLATAAHHATAADEALLLDADLAVLATSAEEYAEYARAVREEYAEVPEAAWRQGRADVLRHLLAAPQLFATEHMRQHAEASARGNLTAELTTLTHS